MLHKYAREKIKKVRQSVDYAVFFIFPKNQDIDPRFINLLEFQLFFIRSIGYHADIALNYKDVLAKAQALDCKLFACLPIDYYVDWNKKLLDWMFRSLHHVHTAAGDKNFFFASLDYAKDNVIKDFEWKIDHDTIEYNDVFKKIKHGTKYYENCNFDYEKTIHRINKNYKINSFILPWNDHQTKNIIEKLKNCDIYLYSDEKINCKDKRIKDTFILDLYSDKSVENFIKKIKVIKPTTYFYTGTEFVDFDKAMFYNTRQRCEIAQDVYKKITTNNSSIYFGGVFPWGPQDIFKYPNYHDWMGYRWNLNRF